MLLQRDADPELENQQGYRALHYACGEGNMPVVRLLVETAGVDVRAKSKDKLTPLLCAMINSRREVADSAPILAEICPSPSLLSVFFRLCHVVADACRRHARHESHNPCRQVVVYLLERDRGLLTIVDTNGDYPLHFAVLEKLTDMVALLLEEVMIAWRIFILSGACSVLIDFGSGTHNSEYHVH